MGTDNKMKDSALQRIKEIENYYSKNKTSSQIHELHSMNIELLLNAFNVMREIANEANEHNWVDDLDKDFERRMSK